MRFYSPEMESISRNNISLEADLRKAISARAVRSPLSASDRSGDRIHRRGRGASSLDAGRNLASHLPHVFIDIAEETGLINEIGAWVLEEACTQAAAWQNLGYAPLQIAVNLSPVQFLRQDIVQLVAETLQTTGLGRNTLSLSSPKAASSRMSREPS